MAEPRPAMLIISFSPIAHDARVLKQIARFAEDFAITTCGYGPAPSGVDEHLTLPDSARYDERNPKLVVLRQYRAIYWSLPAVRLSRAFLKHRVFDVVIANDVETVPLALRLKPTRGVLADLHEYSPRLHEDNEGWRRWIAPWFRWLVRTYVASAASWTTVGEGLAREYEREFGFRPLVVTNAAPYREGVPTPVGRPLRLVHSGAGLRNRQLHLMAEAVEAASADVTLDFYLTANDPKYLEELKAFAAASNRVVVHDPVPYERLVETLAGYDVGVFLLPPVNFNYEMALPNKLFDFVQARLGVIVGPSPEMADYVNRYGFGVVARDFTVDALTTAIDGLTDNQVRAFKAAAHAHARELSSENQNRTWEEAVEALAAQSALQ